MEGKPPNPARRQLFHMVPLPEVSSARVWLEAIRRVRGLGAGDFLVGVDGEEKEVREGVVDDDVQLAVVVVDIGEVR